MGVFIWYNIEVKVPTLQQNDVNWQTQGQLGAKQLLESFLNPKASGSLPHAFLFLGPEGIGKYNLAKEFAQNIFTTLGEASEILEYDFEESPSVESLREIIGFSSLTSIGQKKVFLLRNFEQASIGAVNSLLKTLEEPSTSSLFILVSNSNSTIPTIKSRCITVRCYPAKATSNAQSLFHKAVAPYPLLAQKLEEFPETVQQLEENLQLLKSPNLTQVNTLSQQEPIFLKLLLQLWVELLKQDLEATNLLSTIHNLRVATQARFDLSKSYNTKLVLQQFILETK